MQKDNLNQELRFPKGFLWGSSMSAYQVEGGIVNDWSEWEKSEVRSKKLEKKGENIEDYVCGKACDFYNRYEEDFDLAKSLHTNAIRIGLEWARIEPEAGTWDVGAIKRYHEILGAAKKRGFKTVVTLWHWTNPLWFAKDGGWASKNAVSAYARYVDFVISEFGGYIDYWVTLNEPLVHVANGYLKGNFPPGRRNVFKAMKVFRNLAKANNEAYQKIHAYFPEAQVSITGLLNYYEPARKWNPIEVLLAKLFHYLGNEKFLRKIKNHIDYIGFDYYFHYRIVWYPPFRKNINKKTTDMGWEIYPEGIYHVLKYLAKFKKPIIVLENGLADAEDKERAQFIRDHLFFIHKAIQEGVDVRGYFYWSLLDNFEWDKGWAPKFGLFAVNRDDFTREKRASAEVYGEICRRGAVG